MSPSTNGRGILFGVIVCSHVLPSVIHILPSDLHRKTCECPRVLLLPGLTCSKGVNYWDTLNWLNIISLAAMQGESHILPQVSILKRKVRTIAIVIQRVTSMYHQRQAIVIALYGFFACHFLVSTISTGIVSSQVSCGMYGLCPSSLRSCALLTPVSLSVSSATVLRPYHQGVRTDNEAAKVHWFAVDRLYHI
jgi:hypothetical protein